MFLPLRWLSHRSGNWQPKTYVKPNAAITVFELLMMGGVSPETCREIKKRWNNKFYYTVLSCWFFL
jgi:metal-dependent HD superfamily phosphatase/phosphodiesterase